MTPLSHHSSNLSLIAIEAMRLLVQIHSILVGVLYSVSRRHDISSLTKRSKPLPFEQRSDLSGFFKSIKQIHLAKTEPQKMYHPVLSQISIEHLDYYQSEMQEKKICFLLSLC